MFYNSHGFFRASLPSRRLGEKVDWRTDWKSSRALWRFFSAWAVAAAIPQRLHPRSPRSAPARQGRTDLKRKGSCYLRLSSTRKPSINGQCAYLRNSCLEICLGLHDHCAFIHDLKGNISPIMHRDVISNSESSWLNLLSCRLSVSTKAIFAIGTNPFFGGSGR